MKFPLHPISTPNLARYTPTWTSYHPKLTHELSARPLLVSLSAVRAPENVPQ